MPVHAREPKIQSFICFESRHSDSLGFPNITAAAQRRNLTGLPLPRTIAGRFKDRISMP